MRIVHASDLHHDGSPERFGAMVAEFERLRTLAPDLVVLSGDLTAAGRPRELAEVGAALGALDGVPLVHVPGNRDLPELGTADVDVARWLSPVRTVPARAGDPEGGPQPDAPFAYLRRFGWANAYLATPGLCVVGLSTTPSVDEGALARATSLFAASAPGDLRILVAHHAFLPVPNKKMKRGDVFGNAGDVLAMAFALGVSLVLTGHLHRSRVWQLGDGATQIVMSQAGSLLDVSGQKENVAHVIDTGSAATGVTVTRQAAFTGEVLEVTRFAGADAADPARAG